MFLRGIPDSCRCETCDGRFRCALLDLPTIQRTELDAISRQCFSAGGTVLFLQGEAPEGVFLIRQGWVKLFRSSAAGDVTSTALVSSGYLVGLPEVFSEQPRPLGAEAVSGCDFDFVPAEAFRQFTSRHGDVALRLLKGVCGVLHQLSLDLAGHEPSVGRLMVALQKLAADCGRRRDGGVRLELAFTVGDLADQIGCSRQWTSKLLGDLEGDGMIQRRKGWITLTDRGLTH
jgi:CRP/FNR family cyclic AMP-dependent transcriptional regulator